MNVNLALKTICCRQCIPATINYFKDPMTRKEAVGRYHNVRQYVLIGFVCLKNHDELALFFCKALFLKSWSIRFVLTDCHISRSRVSLKKHRLRKLLLRLQQLGKPEDLRKPWCPNQLRHS